VTTRCVNLLNPIIDLLCTCMPPPPPPGPSILMFLDGADLTARDDLRLGGFDLYPRHDLAGQNRPLCKRGSVHVFQGLSSPGAMADRSRRGVPDRSRMSSEFRFKIPSGASSSPLTKLPPDNRRLMAPVREISQFQSKNICHSGLHVSRPPASVFSKPAPTRERAPCSFLFLFFCLDSTV
jgi:hypothetical protein